MSFLNRSPSALLSIAKVAAILTLTAVAAIARFAVPYSIAALSPAIPLLRFFLEPPYLFITVHLIIVAIWKLSDQNPLKNPNDNVTPSKTASAEILVEPDPATPVSASKSAASCVTTDSEENSVVSSRFESDDVAARTVVLKKSATWERSSEAAAAAAVERAVKRSATMKEWPAAVERNEELDRRFEEFIKKNYDQIRSY